MAEIKGQCLCGGVTFHAVSLKPEMGACHCSLCRRWSGGVFLSVDCGSSLKFNNQELLGTYPSSDYGERLFCKKCGSSLAWRSKDQQMSFVSIQSLDNPEQFNFALEIYIDAKPDNYRFANQTVEMTEQQVIEHFSSGS